MFSNNSSAKIWEVIDKERYKVCKISTQQKTVDDYKTDFTGYVKFVGKANREVNENAIIKIKSCGVRNHYDKELKKQFTDFVIFDFEEVEF